MAATTISHRRKAAAADRKAKERRQLYLVAGLGAILLVVLVFELPKLLSHGGSSSSAAPSTPATVALAVVTPGAATTANPSARSLSQRAELRAAMKQSARDIFVAPSITPAPATLGSVPNPAGLHDPFASPAAPESDVAPAPPVKPAPTIKGTIVLGKPGAGTVAVHGWIVILASVPTARGRSAAGSVAASAKRAGLGKVSILNSSNRKPLRGGYWVVYTGPFNTLGDVNQNAGTVHGHGFTAAYIRQLVVYKKK